MDRTQQFLKECLFTKNFEDPSKPITDNRLQETLLISPTDGGVRRSLKRNKGKLKVTAGTIAEADKSNISSSIKHANYRRINKNARVALRDYINRCKNSARSAKRIGYERNITEKATLMEFLKNNDPQLLESLPKFHKFRPMHELLWMGYLKEMLNIPEEVSDTSKFNINRSQTLFKLSMADYNGAFLKIVKSVNKNMIGIEGIVIWDSQKNFIMITEGTLVDEIKCIPKKGTVFAFEVPLNADDALQFSILGDRFKYRSSDRAGRKFKARRVDDMLYYLDQSF